MDLDALPPLRDVISAHGLRAEKKLGQNFLLDQNITDKIARHAGDLSDKTVFEIGPGPGGLTRSLLRAGAKKVVAVEFDPRAVAALQDLQDAADGRLDIVQGDALDTDLLKYADGNRLIVANLPYNIATLLLTKWLKESYLHPKAYAGFILMFQKEVAQRIVAHVGDKYYGRLSVISNWLCETKKLFDLSPSAFVPAPKVTSSVVRFIPKNLAADAPDFSMVETITAAAFGQRRKMIRSSLANYAQFFEAAGFDPQLRAENLSPEDYVRLAKILT